VGLTVWPEQPRPSYPPSHCSPASPAWQFAKTGRARYRFGLDEQKIEFAVRGRRSSNRRPASAEATEPAPKGLPPMHGKLVLRRLPCDRSISCSACSAISPDPRRAAGKLYKLQHVLLFSILAVVTGVNSYHPS
jgi:hypothetical protein